VSVVTDVSGESTGVTLRVREPKTAGFRNREDAMARSEHTNAQKKRHFIGSRVLPAGINPQKTCKVASRTLPVLTVPQVYGQV
jgi:hypothetical protein